MRDLKVFLVLNQTTRNVSVWGSGIITPFILSYGSKCLLAMALMLLPLYANKVYRFIYQEFVSVLKGTLVTVIRQVFLHCKLSTFFTQIYMCVSNDPCNQQRLFVCTTLTDWAL
jgi:hypothetical protein